MTAHITYELATHQGLARDPSVARLGRLLASIGHRPPGALDDRQLSALINSEREAREKLLRHLELEGGQL